MQPITTKTIVRDVIRKAEWIFVTKTSIAALLQLAVEVGIKTANDKALIKRVEIQ